MGVVTRPLDGQLWNKNLTRGWGNRFSSSPDPQTEHKTHAASYTMVTVSYFSGDKAARA